MHFGVVDYRLEVRGPQIWGKRKKRFLPPFQAQGKGGIESPSGMFSQNFTEGHTDNKLVQFGGGGGHPFRGAGPKNW